MASPAEIQGNRCLLRLYVAGNSPNSVAALANLRAICQECALDKSCIETIDMLDEPLRALEDGVFVTPMLVRLSPPPLRIVGSLSEREDVVQLLGVERREG